MIQNWWAGCRVMYREIDSALRESMEVEALIEIFNFDSCGGAGPRSRQLSVRNPELQDEHKKYTSTR